MASLKQLVEASCGQPNALVAFSNQVSNRAVDGAVHSSTRWFEADHTSLAAEYFNDLAQRLPGPAGFSMDGLLREVQNIPLDASHTHKEARQWASEYQQDVVSFVEPYGPVSVQNDPALQAAWHNSEQMQAFENQVGSTKWSTEYLENAERMEMNEMLQGVPNDPALWNTEFMKFMQQEYGDARAPDTEVMYGKAWQEASNHLIEEETAPRSSFWDNMHAQWDSLQSSAEQSWLADYSRFSSSYDNYKFSDSNPFTATSDSLQKGKECLARGELANAIWHFESAVQHEATNAEAWQYLGIAQAENEQEPSAIAALKKCLSLQPENTAALATLMVSYTNESLYADACRTMREWLAKHPKYSGLANLAAADEGPKYHVSSFLDLNEFRAMEDLLLKAVHTASGEIDSDVQNALGVLYNMSGDYTKAVDCFQVALQLQPENARLWNRLGATLANSNRSAEAVAAYDKALSQYPGFVRARYNLGICCMNLRAYREAIDHFLSALSLQQRGIGPHGAHTVSPSIWTSLRMAVAQHDGAQDALRFVDERNFDALARFFNWDLHEENAFLKLPYVQ